MPNEITELPNAEEKGFETSLRPSNLSEFIGQKHIKNNLGVFIQSSLHRGKTLDHVLLTGPPGLGKTTLAQIIAREMDSGLHNTSGPAIEKQGDLAAILTNLEPNSVLFIDEIHRLHKSIEEILYSAMEDFMLDIVIGQGPGARAMRINLPEFTLVGATTKSGSLSTPLRDRFGIPLRLAFYDEADLLEIILRSASVLNVPIGRDAAEELAKRSRATPRIAIRLLKRTHDFAVAENGGEIDLKLTRKALRNMDVNEMGLDRLDNEFLQVLGATHKGGPVGISTLAVSLSEDRETIEEVCEPFLIQKGLIRRTSRGRVLTEHGQSYLRESLLPKSTLPA